MNPGNQNKIANKICEGLLIFAVIIAIVALPMLFAKLLHNTSLLSCIPFSASEWFAFWPGYLSLIASILLDVFAILFSFYIFTDDQVRNKVGTISIDHVYVSKLSDNGESFHSKIKFIDSNPLLSYNHQIELVQMNVYLCTSIEAFDNENLFDKEFHVNEDYYQKMLPIIIKGDSNDDGQNSNTRITPMFCKNELKFDVQFDVKDKKPYKEYCVDFEKRNTFVQDIWKDCNLDAINSKLLIVEFSYRIHNTSKYFDFPILNKLYKNYVSKKTTLQYNRIHFIYDGLKNSNPINQEELSYTACSNVRNILK